MYKGRFASLDRSLIMGGREGKGRGYECCLTLQETEMGFHVVFFFRGGA